ncbi:MAG: helix-turn-helix transcriptional regulator [Paludibacteraceae bacterium]|nr:helix-turn-helix transcriptional regulator [Paludibacteraceae bacterium]
MYELEQISSGELMQQLAQKMQKRRLEKGLSRQTLADMSGVPAPTIARFEQHYAISMRQYVDLAITMGYAEDVKHLMDEPKYKTMDELETIRNNRNRKRGGKSERL